MILLKWATKWLEHVSILGALFKWKMTVIVILPNYVKCSSELIWKIYETLPTRNITKFTEKIAYSRWDSLTTRVNQEILLSNMQVVGSVILQPCNKRRKK